jgi:hypothetical protein
MGYPIMTSIDPRAKDPAQPHHSENGGHELSDFSWTTVLWLIPISVVILLVFFYVCINWFRGAKDHEVTHKQAEFVPTELQAYRAQQDEILNSYKILDNEKGRYRIPVARAMELMAQEHQGKAGREWAPITDIYLEGAAFAAATGAAAGSAEADDGIQVGDAPEDRKGAKPAPSAKAPTGKAAQPAQNSAEKNGATHNAPGGAPRSKPEAAPQGKK